MKTLSASLLSALCVLLACGIAEPGELLSGSDYGGERWVASPPPPEPDAPVLVVPPDGARVDLTVAVDGKDFDTTASRLRAAVETLTDAISEHEGCTVTWEDYGPPAARGGGAFAAGAQLRLRVDLQGLVDTTARADRLDDCLRRVDAAALGEGVGLQRSAPVITLSRPDAHLGALLEQRLVPLRALGELANVPETFEPARCHSSGTVSVIDRRLAGVTLGLEFRCDGGVPGPG